MGRLQRKPDVAFVSAERWPLYREVPDAEAWKVVPNLAVEVVSPTSTVTEIVDKILDYFRHGVEQVWIVLPRQKMVQVFDSPAAMHAVMDDGVLPWRKPLLPGFELPLSDLFPHDTEKTRPAHPELPSESRRLFDCPACGPPLQFAFVLPSQESTMNDTKESAPGLSRAATSCAARRSRGGHGPPTGAPGGARRPRPRVPRRRQRPRPSGPAP